jgi:biopolymer transport protein ExbD
MNYLLEVCLVAVTLVTSVTSSIVAGPGLKLIRGTEATASADQVLQKGISVQLPVSSDAAPMPDADNDGALIVSVTDRGSVYFGIDPVTPPALVEKIKSVLSDQKMLYIKSDARTPYADVVKVLDEARMAGTAATTLLTSQSESAPTGTVRSPKGLQVLLVPPTASGSEPAVVRVLNSGQHSSTLQINDQQIPWATLQSSLMQLFLNRSEKVVLVKADVLLPFADVVHVIDMCHSTGAKVVLVAPRTVAR